ncbi:hypothetical protein Syun_022287 [Stephania yunnanensis]|uniref:Uncharacterized protein n=1 Tax=Stephania yunnanensis TaxID=152371 RepID=A0AAP0I2N8_9MAGN
MGRFTQRKPTNEFGFPFHAKLRNGGSAGWWRSSLKRLRSSLSHIFIDTCAKRRETPSEYIWLVQLFDRCSGTLIHNCPIKSSGLA